MANSAMDDWQNQILERLQQRNRIERYYFSDVIAAHNRLFESSASLKAQNVKLEIVKAQLEQENATGRSNSGSANPMANEKISMLEQKVFKLQEELTEMHRRKGENAQKIIELNRLVQTKDEEIAKRDKKVNDTVNIQETLQAEKRKLEQRVLKDEQQALQLACTSIEDKLRQVQNENRDLIERWMREKARAADMLNDANDKNSKIRQQQVQNDLLEAARETPNPKITGNQAKVVPLPIVRAILPSKMLCKFDAHEGEVFAAKFSPSGSIFATGGGDRIVKIWELQGAKAFQKDALRGSNGGTMSIEFDPQERYILTASNDFAGRVWSINDQRLRHTLTGHSNKVLAAKFLGETGKVVTGSNDRTLKVWDLKNRACIRTIFAGSSCNDLVTIDGTGANIISGHYDKRIRFWDVRSESSCNEISLHGKVTSLSLSPDGTYLLSSSRDDMLKLIDLRMNQVTGTFCSDGFRLALDYCRACFSPDGQYVTCGSFDGTVFIWNTNTTRVEKTLKEHTNPVISCTWHPQGTHILSSDKLRRIVIWGEPVY